MKIVAFNGSPRKNKNTATLLEHALKGAASAGADTELLHLYDFNFKGCSSCFACKKNTGKHYGRCAMKDEISPVLDRLNDVDGIILGSPLYFMSETGVMRMFRERLLFPLLTYERENPTLCKKAIHIGLILTMNISDRQIDAMGIQGLFESMAFPLRMVFGNIDMLLSTDTMQFAERDNVKVTIYDSAHKMKRHKEAFPKDCERALEMGRRFASETPVLQNITFPIQKI